jgi:hypothetical protein
MFAGRIVGEVAGDAADESSLGRMMANLAAPPEQAFADAGADA